MAKATRDSSTPRRSQTPREKFRKLFEEKFGTDADMPAASEPTPRSRRPEEIFCRAMEARLASEGYQVTPPSLFDLATDFENVKIKLDNQIVLMDELAQGAHHAEREGEGRRLSALVEAFIYMRDEMQPAIQKLYARAFAEDRERGAAA